MFSSLCLGNVLSLEVAELVNNGNFDTSEFSSLCLGNVLSHEVVMRRHKPASVEWFSSLCLGNVLSLLQLNQ